MKIEYNIMSEETETLCVPIKQNGRLQRQEKKRPDSTVLARLFFVVLILIGRQ